MAVQVVFVVLFLFVAAVETQTVKGDVKFWRENVTLSFPMEGIWKAQGDSKESDKNGTSLTLKFKGKAHYIYEYDDNDGEAKKYQFYVKGKACENCFELDGYLFMLVILVDVIGTAVLMRIIYVCSKGKRPYAPPPSQPARRSRPRPDQSSAYESLNPNTQATGTYSTVVHRTG